MKQKRYKFHEDPMIKKLVHEQLAGYKKMNEFVLQEQRENLPKMTLEKSQEIYEGFGKCGNTRENRTQIWAILIV